MTIHRSLRVSRFDGECFTHPTTSGGTHDHDTRSFKPSKPRVSRSTDPTLPGEGAPSLWEEEVRHALPVPRSPSVLDRVHGSGCSRATPSESPDNGFGSRDENSELNRRVRRYLFT